MTTKDRKVLITGSTGYIGSALATLLTANGWHIKTFDTQHFGNSIADLPNSEHVVGDILDFNALANAMGDCTDVVHLAGIVTDELVDMNHDYGRRVNVDGTMNTIMACSAQNIPRLIFASSSSVYGTAAETGLPGETTTPLPKTEYAQQKLEGERLVIAYGQTRGRTSAAVRQATAMGPAPRMRLDTVVNVFSKQAYFDQLLTPFGGDQYRSNVHVDDAARLYETLLLTKREFINGEVFNLTDSNMPVGDIANAVAEAYAEHSGKKAKVVIKDVVDTRSYRLDGSYVQRQLGFETTKGVYAAALDNFRFFDTGAIGDPNDSLYVNNKRMASIMEANK